MKNRNYVEEILNVKSREKSILPGGLIYKIEEINSAFEEMRDIEKELPNEVMRYFPITIVSCIQSYFREIIIKLVDSGEPYIDNISNLNQIQNFKFNIDIIKSIKKEKFSMGELIAHLLPCNKLEDFNKYISALINTNLLGGIKNTFVIENFGEILNSVKSIFELRNIFCHEYAFNTTLTLDQIEEMKKSYSIFLSFVHLYLSELLNPELEKNKKNVNKESEKAYAILINEIDGLVEKIIAKNKSIKNKGLFNENLFIESIKKWKEYIVLKVGAEYDIFKNSNAKFIYFTLLNHESKRKIEELKEQYEKVLGRDKRMEEVSGSKESEFLREVFLGMSKE